MKINVPEKYADLYLKALTEKKRALEERIEEFKREIEEIDTHISNLTSMPIFKEPQFQTIAKWDTATYRIQWSWTRKIGFYYESASQLATSAEVVDFILEKEPEEDRSKVRSSISAALSNGIRSGQYKKFTDPVTNTTYYGPSEWFNSQEQPDVVYIPDNVRQRLTG
jgi:hypothetical protein